MGEQGEDRVSLTSSLAPQSIVLLAQFVVR